MPFETSKCMSRRLHDNRFITRYFVGNGINVGSGNDELSFYGALFPLMKEVKEWDVKNGDGDGMLLEGIEDESLDFVHSSHCLEHLDDPTVALTNWLRVLKPGGHIVFTVPEEDLFEQGIWPSGPSGEDHNTSWTIAKSTTWAPNSINMIPFLLQFIDDIFILKIELIDRLFLYEKEVIDQTILPAAHECAIEVVLRKKTKTDREYHGHLDERHVVAAKAVQEYRENDKYSEDKPQEMGEWEEQANQSSSETIKPFESSGF